MGMCLEDFGKMSIEVRRESFIIHTGYGYKGEEHDDSSFGKHWRESGHPEFMLEDLDNLIAALKDAKHYLQGRRVDMKTKKTKHDYNKRAVETVSCAFCNAKAGEPCQGSRGYPVAYTHSERRREAAIKAGRS